MMKRKKNAKSTVISFCKKNCSRSLIKPKLLKQQAVKGKVI